MNSPEEIEFLWNTIIQFVDDCVKNGARMSDMPKLIRGLREVFTIAREIATSDFYSDKNEWMN